MGFLFKTSENHLGTSVWVPWPFNLILDWFSFINKQFVTLNQKVDAMAKKQDATNATVADVLAGEQQIESEVADLTNKANSLVALSGNEATLIVQLQQQIADLQAAGGLTPDQQQALNDTVAGFTRINGSIQTLAGNIAGALPPAPAPGT